MTEERGDLEELFGANVTEVGTFRMCGRRVLFQVLLESEGDVAVGALVTGIH